MNLEPAITQMAFTPKREDGCRVVCTDFLLFGIVSHTHTNVVVTCSTVNETVRLEVSPNLIRNVPPYIEGQFKTRNQNALVDLSSSISQRMLAWNVELVTSSPS